MQLTADFLFEPKANAVNGKSNPALFDTAKPQENRFASMFAEQQRKQQPAPVMMRQAASVPAPVEQPRSEPQRVERNERKSEPAANKNTDNQQADTTSETQQPVVSERSQKTDSDEEAKVEQDESGGEPVSGWGQLDPLLLQVMQGSKVDVELNPELAEQVDDFLLDGVEALPQEVFANILAGKSGAEQKSEQIKLDLSQAGGKLQPQVDDAEAETGADVATEGEVLAFELHSEEQPLLSAQLAMQDKVEAKPVNANFAGEIKTSLEGQGRAEALMRTEAVQQTSAARQVPGQPLNMQQPGWSKELTDKVMWMSSQNLKSAEIKMNPAELGRLEIRIQISNEQTQVSFVSPHAGVRDSLDSQMFRLREMLAQQGMQDVDVNVSDQSADGQEQRELHQLMAANGASMHDGQDEEMVETVTELPLQNTGTDGRVSYYV